METKQIKIGAYTEIPKNFTDDDLQRAKKAVIAALVEDIMNAGFFYIKETMPSQLLFADPLDNPDLVTVGFKMPLTIWSEKEADVKHELYAGEYHNKISCD